MPLPGLSSSRSFPGITDEYKETWKNVVEEVISCVLDNSPSDEILAMYLGSDIANKYRVCHIQFCKNDKLDGLNMWIYYEMRKLNFKFAFRLTTHHL